MSAPNPAPPPSRDGDAERRVAAQPYQHLVGVVSRLSMARDVDTIMSIVRRAARELTGADGATFILREGDLCYYADEDAIGPLWKGQRFPLDQCLSGWVMVHGIPAVVTDIFNDPRIPLIAYEPTFVRSVAMVPIRAASPIGAIGTYWASQRTPEPAEITLLQALADTTSVAIENVQVYRDLERRVQDRTAALESFTTSVSHDLRAPIRQIELFAGMLLEAQPESLVRGVADGIRTIGREAKQIGDMADALLELSRTSELVAHPEPIDLAALARSVACEHQARFTHAVTFVAPNEVMTCMDPQLARIALTNLLGNAWKFSANVAEPTVEFGVLTLAAGAPRTLFVRDNGAGFDSENAMHLFGVFKRMHKQHEFPGTGVGLATVQRVIQKHGGTIWAESRRGEGATFYFTVPSSVAGA